MKYYYTIENLIEAVNTSKSISEVIRKLNCKINGGTHSQITTKIKNLNIDTSHFTGQLWSKGLDALKDHRLGNTDKIFIENSKYSRSYIRKLIMHNNLIDYKCSCGLIDTWRDKPIVLELEHKNGIRSDHRLENLEFLCPNCHSQTFSYRGRNINKSTVHENVIIEAIKTSYSINETCRKVGLAGSSNYNRIRRILIKNDVSFLKKEIRKRVSDYEPNWRNRPKPHTRKVERPSKEDLINLIKEKSIVKIAKQFKVTDNTIRKWCELYNIDHKHISPFSFKNLKI